MARCTLPVNFAGVPALSIPVPVAGPIPASLQLVGPWGAEPMLLAAGLVVEEAVASAPRQDRRTSSFRHRAGAWRSSCDDHFRTIRVVRIEMQVVQRRVGTRRVAAGVGHDDDLVVGPPVHGVAQAEHGRPERPGAGPLGEGRHFVPGSVALVAVGAAEARTVGGRAATRATARRSTPRGRPAAPGIAGLVVAGLATTCQPTGPVRRSGRPW